MHSTFFIQICAHFFSTSENNFIIIFLWYKSYRFFPSIISLLFATTIPLHVSGASRLPLPLSFHGYGTVCHIFKITFPSASNIESSSVFGCARSTWFHRLLNCRKEHCTSRICGKKKWEWQWEAESTSKNRCSHFKQISLWRRKLSCHSAAMEKECSRKTVRIQYSGNVKLKLKPKCGINNLNTYLLFLLARYLSSWERKWNQNSRWK